MDSLFGRRVYACAQCGHRQPFGGLWIEKTKEASCPSCGTFRLSMRRKIDPIERVYSSPLSWFRKLAGGTIYRCRFCRLQFYDFRELREESSEALQQRAAPQVWQTGEARN